MQKIIKNWRYFTIFFFAGIFLGACHSAQGAGPEVAAYYFPQWHVDPLNNFRSIDGLGGWTEWESMKTAKPKFVGHDQPKVPLWGYEMEDNPEVMAQKIDAAASHGVDAFIFDWYHYESKGDFLRGALDRGFLQAPNHNRVKFGIMLTNHDIKLGKKTVPREPAITYEDVEGEISKDVFATKVCPPLQAYFADPGYWKVGGKPFFSIIDIGQFIRGVGKGVDNNSDADDDNPVSGPLANTKAALDACFSGNVENVHFNVTDWGFHVNSLSAERTGEIITALGIDSVTTYSWKHLVEPPELKKLPALPPFQPERCIDPLLGLEPDESPLPVSNYEDWAKDALVVTNNQKARYGSALYFPHVTMGWDHNPRFPNCYQNTVINNTPAKFEDYLNKIKDENPNTPVVTINSWNEWSEGSYIEPNTKDGMGYLEAIRRVFVTPDETNSMPPVTAITAPAAEATISGITMFSASAFAEPGISAVNFFVDNAFKHQDTTAPYQFNLDTAALSNGKHVLKVLTHNNNNVSSLARVTVTVADGLSPDTTILTKPAALTKFNTASFTFSSTETGGTFQCKLDDGAYAACTSPKSYAGLAVGNHVFSVKAIDAANNADTSAASYGWVIENTPPTISNGSPSGELPSGTTSTSIALATTENATCRYATTANISYTAMTAFPTTGGKTHSKEIANLSEGTSYAYFVRCQDAIGNANNEDYPISFSIGKVAAAPVASKTDNGDNHKDNKKEEVRKRSISVSKKKISRGQTLIERGKGFSKKNTVSIYFSKAGGGYYAPKKVKTNSSGKFSLSYKIPMNKATGNYSWYVVDDKTKKKSKVVKFVVK